MPIPPALSVYLKDISYKAERERASEASDRKRKEREKKQTIKKRVKGFLSLDVLRLERLCHSRPLNSRQTKHSCLRGGRRKKNPSTRALSHARRSSITNKTNYSQQTLRFLNYSSSAAHRISCRSILGPKTDSGETRAITRLIFNS